MPPAVLAGRYELISELGRGSMGTVWRARDLRFDRLVAVKLVRLGNSAAGFGGQLAGRFDREILAVGRLNHPNIATAYDAGREGDHMYLVTELVAGQSLAELTRERQADGLGPFPIDAALDIAVQVCAGLAVAHRAGVVHRDLKPANLMVSDAAEVKIVDFGIARLVEDNLPRLTQPGTMVGTLAYGSPEQLEGKVVDGRSDLYALGCMLYELIAGARPFVAADAESLMRLHIFATAVPLTTRRPDCPAGVAALVAELMAKHPDQRPQHAEEVAARIEELRNPPDPGRWRATVVTGYGPGERPAPPAPGYPGRPPEPGWPPEPGIPPNPRQPAYEDVVVPPSRERATIVVGDEPPRGGQQPYPPAGQQPGYYQSGPTPSPTAVAAWHGDRPEIRDAHARARYRLYWLLTAGLGVIAVAAVALLVITGHKTLTVRSLTIATPRAAACNGTVDVTATVLTDGNAGTITYRWTRSDGAPPQDASIDVPGGQTSTSIHLLWTFHGKATFHGTATLKILSPGSANASAPVAYSCK